MRCSSIPKFPAMTAGLVLVRRGCARSTPNESQIYDRKRDIMCVAMPGKVVKVEGTVAEVDFSGNLVRAEAGLVQVKPGDYVLVHAGCILQVISEDEHKNLADLFEEIENLC